MALAAWQATIVDESGDIQANAQIEVRLESTGALAAIYEDRDGSTPLDNPFQADENGFARFYAAGGAHRIDATLGGFSRTYRHQAVGLLAEQDVAQDDQFYYRQTEAEIDADVSIVNFEYEECDSRRYGAVFDGVTDDSAAHQAALDVLAEKGGGVWYIHDGKSLAVNLVLNASDVRIEGNGWLVPASDDPGDIVLEIGTGTGSSQPDLVYRVTGHVRIGNPDSTATPSNVQGLVIRNGYLFDLAVDARNVVDGLALLPGANQRVAYSTFHLGQFRHCNRGVYIAPTSSGFANSNNYFGGQFRTNSTSGAGIVIANATSPPNHNVFYSPVFEGAGQAFDIDGTSNSIIEARFEPSTDTAPSSGVWFNFGSNSARNNAHFRYSLHWMTSAKGIDHGAGTRSSDNTFTYSGDIAAYCSDGTPIALTIGGTTYHTFVRTASHSGGTTTVRVMSPVVTGNPTAIMTARLKDTGSLNTLRADIGTVSAISRVVNLQSYPNQMVSFPESSLMISSLGQDYPALTLAADGANANRVFQVVDLATGRTAYIRGDGRMSVSGFHMNGGTPATQGSHIADPSGGTTIDAEARTAINAILLRLKAIGLVASS